MCCVTLDDSDNLSSRRELSKLLALLSVVLTASVFGLDEVSLLFRDRLEADLRGEAGMSRVQWYYRN